MVSEDGDVVYTHEEITRGQNVFLTRGIQQYGSILGHGAYLGPDYTAEYLRLSSEHIHQQLEQQGVQEQAGDFRIDAFDVIDGGARLQLSGENVALSEVADTQLPRR